MTDFIVDRPHAELHGDITDTHGRLTVVAHGVTMSRSAEDAEPIFAWSRLREHDLRLARYDARGHGRSTGHAEPADYRWPHLADDLLAIIDELSPTEPVDAIGASMGTATILLAALSRPDRFRRIVLSIPPTAWETRAAQVQGYRAGADLIESSGIDAFLGYLEAEPVIPILAESGLRTRNQAPDVTEALLPSVLRGAAQSDLPPTAQLRALTLPTLILAWDTDPGHPVSTAHILAQTLPNAQLEIANTGDNIASWPKLTARFLSDAH